MLFEAEKILKPLGGTTCLTLLVKYGLVRFYVCSVVSRIAMVCHMFRHFGRVPALDK